MRASQSNISLIIPAYNEAGRIRTVVSNYATHFPDIDIIVVCNGCNDNTPAIVTALCTQHPQIRLLTFNRKLGKGGSILEGFKAARGDMIGFVDADESVGPEDVEKMFAALSYTDAVIASRRHKDSRITVRQPWKRRFASRIFNMIVRIMFSLNLKDTQCGAKVFRKEAVRDVISEMRTRGFEFDVELLWKLKRKGYPVVEFPVTWSHSEGSTFSMKNTPKMFFSLLKVRLWK